MLCRYPPRAERLNWFKSSFPILGLGRYAFACRLAESAIAIPSPRWGYFPELQYPRVPGHEIAGVIDAIGEGEHLFKVGQRVGLGWHGGHCNYCPPCRRGDFILCENGQIPGISYDGGYADYVVAPANAVAFMPEELKDAEAAPLLCAGITTYNSLRNSGARPGDTVAILGIGGLGHLGVQFAAKSGYRTVAIARGAGQGSAGEATGRARLHRQRKAGFCGGVAETGRSRGDSLHHHRSGDACSGGERARAERQADHRRRAGKAARSEYVSDDPWTAVDRGWPSGTGMDCEDTLKFSVLSGVRPMIETFPLEKAADAYERMMSGKARFRAVITMGK